VSQDVRAATARVVAKVMQGQSLNYCLPAQLDNVAARDRGFLQQLCYGTLRHAPRLQGILSHLLEKPFRDKDSDIEALLMVGLYQLDDTRVPDHAAVAATVGACKSLKKNWAKGLSNAILRRYLRERDSVNAMLDVPTRLAHPEWLYAQVNKEWPNDIESIVEANNLQPPMTLRTNALQGTRDSYIKELAEQGLDSLPGSISEHAIYLNQAVDVQALPEFVTGKVSVQDEAAQVAASLLDAKPGERILDACAAPGGKACHLLELNPNLGELVAMDIDPLRLERVEENLERLGLQATVMAGDASNPPAELEKHSFDHILMDAPCSASGVIRRNPDVKLLRREDDIPALADQQLSALTGLWPLLKPGGSFLYATCSILKEENDSVVARFLHSETAASCEKIQTHWGVETAMGRQILPTANGSDGLFYSLLRKAP